MSPHPVGERGEGDMRKFRWLLLPAALVWLTGYEAQSLDECLAETTVDCAIDQAVVAARKIDKPTLRAAAYSYIARVQADAGRDAGAREHLVLVGILKRQIMEPGLRDGISSNQARVHALLGEMDQALAIAENVHESAAAVRAWSWVAESQARAGDNEGANQSIVRALTAAAEMPQERIAFPLALMAIAEAQAGERDEALEAAAAALELASRYDDQLWQARVASLAAVAQAAAGDRGQAVESLVRAEVHLSRLSEGDAPPEQRSSALAFIAWAQALAGDGPGARARLEDLKALIREMPDHYWRSISLSAIALVLAKSE
jgi:tetratricopeptide (TPR) repeat protein